MPLSKCDDFYLGTFNKYPTKWIGFGSQMGLASKKRKDLVIYLPK